MPKRDNAGNNKGWRICIDPRHINEMLPDVNYPLPKIEDILESLSGFIVASRIDLVSGFNQIMVNQDCQVSRITLILTTLMLIYYL